MEFQRSYFVYILASKPCGTLYTGVTNSLMTRTQQHKDDVIVGFTRRYGVHRLVYYEFHSDIAAAIRREKQIKRWRRAWKIALIERDNPRWSDLYESIISAQRRSVRLFNERHSQAT